MNEGKQDQNLPADGDGEDLIETTILPEDAAVDAAPGSGAPAEDATAARDAAGSGDDPVAAANAKAEEHWNNYLRAVAELDNVRKRAARDVEKARRFGVERLAGALLEVADSLEIALEVGDNATVESLLEGTSATQKVLQSVLEKHGVVPVYPEGEPFNPELHEAMSMVESDTVEPNSVVSVVQRGYQLNGRLLRPARVIVARAPAADGQ